MQIFDYKLDGTKSGSWGQVFGGIRHSDFARDQHPLPKTPILLYLPRRDLPPAAAAGSSDLAVAAGFFLPSLCARLCFRAAIKSMTGASFFGFSTAATSPPSSLA